MPGRRPGATRQLPLERERTKADALQRNPPPALTQLEMAAAKDCNGGAGRDSQLRARKRHRKRVRRREPGKRRKSWPTSSVSWPRANASKPSRWNRNFSRRAGKSTRSRAVRKRPLLSVRRLGATWRRCNGNSMQCAASRATAARRRVQSPTNRSSSRKAAPNSRRAGARAGGGAA